MSLINNMLKDLEQREHFKRTAPILSIAKWQQSAKKLNINVKQSVMISVALLLTLILLTLIIIKAASHKQISTMLPATVYTPYPANTLPADNDWLNAVKINAVTLQVKDNVTEITFLLDHRALYRLVSNDMQNQLSLIFDHAELQSELPPVKYLKTAIQSVSSENKHGNARINLTLLPGASLKYVNLNNSDNNPELVVAIENQTTLSTNTSNTTKTNEVKKPAFQTLLAEQYQEALSAADDNQTSLAIERLSALIKADPHFQTARVSLVALLIEQNDLHRANVIVDDGLRMDPTNSSLLELKARLLTSDGKINEAINLLRASSPSLIENPEYHALIAALYEKNNENQLAINLYKQLLSLNPNNSNWWLGLGISLEKLGNIKSALMAYNRASTEGHLNPESAAYLQNRLRALQGNENEKD